MKTIEDKLHIAHELGRIAELKDEIMRYPSEEAGT